MIFYVQVLSILDGVNFNNMSMPSAIVLVLIFQLKNYAVRIVVR